MRLPTSIAPFIVGLLACVACGTAQEGGGAPAPGGPTAPPGSDASPTSPTSAEGCSADAHLVHVITDDGLLYSFNPETLAFRLKGPLSCPYSETITPNSMAIDRQGFAWVNYTDGSLFKLNLADAKCEATNFRTAQGGFRKFGMAFARESAEAGDRLFVSGLGASQLPQAGGRGLAQIDLTSLELTAIGDYSGDLAGTDAELTSSGDGKLYAFFRSQPASIGEVVTRTGAVENVVPLPDVDAGLGFAFSSWGGDFWIYTSEQIGPSKVTRYRPSDRSVKVLIQNTGMRIVGAGVSTCAPTAATK